MQTLDQIGLKYSTDKSSMTHCYLDNYEKYFAPLRDKEFVLLEIGVAGHASMKTWREYFPKAKIYGVDINPDCSGEGVFIGNSTDEAFMNKVLDEIGEPLIIIEDGGHVGHETVKTFQILFPRLKEGGLMAIEDTACFYSTTYAGNFEMNGRSSVYNFFTDLAYHVDIAGRAMTGNVSLALSTENTTFDPVPKYSRMLESIHIHTSLWIFQKR